MFRKSQVSEFIVIGILIMLVAGLLLALRPHAYVGDEQVLRLETSSVNAYVLSCLDAALVEAEGIGIEKSLEARQKAIVEKRMESCVDFDLMRRSGVVIEGGKPTVDIVSSEKVISADLYFPISISVGGYNSRLERFSSQLKRETVIGLNYGLSGLSQSIMAVSADRKAEILLAEETFVSIDEQPVDKISIRSIDRRFSGLENPNVLGNVIYELGPEGADVYPPVEVSLYFEPDEINGDFIPSIGYFDESIKKWVVMESQAKRPIVTGGFVQVPVLGRLSAKLKKFSKFAILLVCKSCRKDEQTDIIVQFPVENNVPEKMPAENVNVCIGTGGVAGFMSCPLHVNDPVILTGSYGSGNPRGEHCNLATGYPFYCDPLTQPHWSQAIDVAGPDGSDRYEVFLPSVNGKIVMWVFDHQDRSISSDWGWVKFFTAQTSSGKYLLRVTHMEQDDPAFAEGELVSSGTRIGRIFHNLDGPGKGHSHVSVEKNDVIVMNPEYELGLCSYPRSTAGCI